jgi:hypothetical protein
LHNKPLTSGSWTQIYTVSNLLGGLVAELVLCSFDDKGHVIFSNDAHGRAHKRKPEQLLNHHYREWTPSSQLAAVENAFARGLDGEPNVFIREFIDSEGSILTGRSQLFAVPVDGKKILIGTFQVIDRPVGHSLTTQDVADYIAAMTTELAKIAGKAGLWSIASNLEDVAIDAGVILEMMSKP